MIRINLFEETRVATKKSGPGPFEGINLAENVGIVVMLGGIGLAIAVVLAWSLFNAGRISDLDGKIAEAEREKKRLERVLKLNEELNAKKKDLEHRIALIKELKDKQDQPVKMMSELSRELAENVWFTSLTFTGDQLAVQGKAISKGSYSKFLSNLERSKHFVDVRSGTVSEGLTRGRRNTDTSGADLVSFEMEATFLADPEAAARKAAEAAEKQATTTNTSSR